MGLRGFNLNAQLSRYVREHRYAAKPLHSTDSLPAYHARPWRVRERLSEQEIATIVKSFKAGSAKHVLAKGYGVNLRSLKKLLGEEEVKRKSRWDRR